MRCAHAESSVQARTVTETSRPTTVAATCDSRYAPGRSPTRYAKKSSGFDRIPLLKTVRPSDDTVGLGIRPASTATW